MHDFLNTKAISDKPDLLADPESAQAWTAHAVQAWSATRGGEVSQPPELTAADVTKLRALRTTITGLVDGDAGLSPGVGPVTTSFTLTDTGELRLEPAGAGWRWLASALWGEILLSQQSGTWRRFKQCHNPRCQSTFYDRSKNNSGVWHSVKVCGNAANLRASRARRRQQGD